MSGLRPVLGLSREDPGDPNGAPSNIIIEQALLGVVLFDNAAFERCGDDLKAEHFHEPFHGRMWRAISDAIGAGRLAEPIALMEKFRNDPAFEDLGGLRYLADLVDRAPPIANARDYGRQIVDLALRRETMRLCHDGVAAAMGDQDMSARDIIEAIEGGLYDLAETGATGRGVKTFSHYLTGAIDMAAAAFDRDGGLAGLSTGLIDLDRMLGGLHKTDLVIIGARPGMGKSALATNIAWHNAKTYAYEEDDRRVRKTVAGGIAGMWSLEMSGEQLALRIMAEESGVSSDRLRKGHVDMAEFVRVREAAAEFSASPLHIDDTGGISIARLATRARRLKRTVGLDLLIVDYLQLLAPAVPGRGENRVQELSEITGALKALAKDLEVPVVALSQLSRKVEDREDKRPQLADLRESGSIEQDADVVIFLYREAYYLQRLEPEGGGEKHLEWQEKMDACHGLAEAIIAKQRHGPTGTVKLHFNGELTKFGNLAREGRGS